MYHRRAWRQLPPIVNSVVFADKQSANKSTIRPDSGATFDTKNNMLQGKLAMADYLMSPPFSLGVTTTMLVMDTLGFDSCSKLFSRDCASYRSADVVRLIQRHQLDISDAAIAHDIVTFALFAHYLRCEAPGIAQDATEFNEGAFTAYADSRRSQMTQLLRNAVRTDATREEECGMSLSLIHI